MTENQKKFWGVVAIFGGVGLFMAIFGILGFVLAGLKPVGITSLVVALMGIAGATVRIKSEWDKNQ